MNMRVLIISHNCISSTTNMGKTLLSYFHGFPKTDLAQLYIHCEEPVDDTVCCNYFRFTDLDALLSRFCLRDLGKQFAAAEISTERVHPRTDRGLLRSAYRYGEHRKAAGYALRELLWAGKPWNTEKLRRWLEDFQPEAVFFASGDYGFSYEIARTVAWERNIPLAVCCVDEYYLHNRNESSKLGRWVHRRFLAQVEKTMADASVIFTICEPLKRLYEPMFQRECVVLHTAARGRTEEASGKRQGIVYLGNLELGREKQLIAIGRALRKLKLPGGPETLDVYSWEDDPKLLREMNLENGIAFHGGISGASVRRILRNSMAVIHTESFDPGMQEITRYSVSAKIPDCLIEGPCLVAYGPDGIASMDYLKEHGAAYRISQPGQLEQGLREILTDASLREVIQQRGRILGQKNHDPRKEAAKLKEKLEEVCDNWGKTAQMATK